MGETIMVLFIFFFLIAMGLIFYGMVSKQSLTTKFQETRQLKSVEIAKNALDLPELSCSENGVKIENCVDMFKALGFFNLVNNSINMQKAREYYFQYLGYSEVRVKVIYPNLCLDASAPGCNLPGTTILQGFSSPDQNLLFREDSNALPPKDSSAIYSRVLPNAKNSFVSRIPIILYNPIPFPAGHPDIVQKYFAFIEVTTYS